ncbi:MAG: hypothetical protein D3920_00130 [Candidatus Electrothrix sp. AW2]|nr:hypothetical protein [Candidatus Electrothrix gigas]
MKIKDLSISSFIEAINVRFRIDGRKYPHFHHISSDDVRKAYLQKMFFFVSTGRTGTAFIEQLLNEVKGVDVYHEPFPCLAEFPNLVFTNKKKSFSKGVLLGARSQRIIECYNRNKIYVESNQVLSFFIREIIECFPNAKIIHLVRNPYSFIKSGMQKGWYSNDTVWEYGRRKCDRELWNTMNQIQKLSWYWTEVNRTIIKDCSIFLTNDKYFLLRLEDIDKKNKIDDLSLFIGREIKYISEGGKKLKNKSKEKEWWCGGNVNKKKSISINFESIEINVHDEFKAMVKKFNYDV